MKKKQFLIIVLVSFAICQFVFPHNHKTPLTTSDLFSYPIPFEETNIVNTCDLGGSCARPELVNQHSGQDFALPEGTPIRAIADGRVAYYQCRHGYGELVAVINHTLPVEMPFKNGLNEIIWTKKIRSIYGHIRDREVRGVGPRTGLRRGHSVRRGDVIGYINDSRPWTGDKIFFCDTDANKEHNGLGGPHLHLGIGLDHDVEIDTDWVSEGYEFLHRFTKGLDFIKKLNIKIESHDSVLNHSNGVLFLKGHDFGPQGSIEIGKLDEHQEVIFETAQILEWSNNLISIRVFSENEKEYPYKDPIQIRVIHENGKIFGEVNFPFRDIAPQKDMWFKQHTTLLWKKNIIRGIGNTGFFDLKRTINFAEFIKMAIIASPFEYSACSSGDRPVEVFTTEDFPMFIPGKGPWYCEFYKKLADLGIFNVLQSIDNARGAPIQNVKRQEAALILAELMNWSVPIDENLIFNDVDLANPYRRFIESVSLESNFDGYPDGKFRPDQDIIRAEASKIIAETFFPENFQK